MKCRLHIHNPTEGGITAEACICCSAVIIIFSLFLTIAGYCISYKDVKEFANEKAVEMALLYYSTGLVLPGIIPSSGFYDKKRNCIENLFVYCEQWGNEVKIIASYKYRSLYGNFNIKVKSQFTRWMGDGSIENVNSVWALPPLERGRKIEGVFGGGLPEYFPVLDAYDQISGAAASIVSVDTTTATYKSGAELMEIIKEKADELADFKYGKSEEITITGKDIDSRELILVIPGNPLNSMQQQTLEVCMDYATGISINLTVRRYQSAMTESDGE